MWKLVIPLLALLPGAEALGYDEPDYEVVRTYDAFELRSYAPFTVADVQVTSDFEDAGSEAFRRLFRYISGNNGSTEDESEEISMTIPVLQEPQPGEGKYVFSFVLPAKYTADTAPRPKDPSVKLRAVPAKHFAVRSYSGTWSEARYRGHEKTLLDAVHAEEMQTQGAAIFARYNAPFSLPFWRRNEVLIEVAP